MLKSNSKKAAENIRNYIVDNFTPEGYTDNPPQEWPEIAAFILATFHSEKYYLPQDIRYYHGSEQAAFADWCASNRLRGHLHKLWNITHGEQVENLAYITATGRNW